MGASSGTRQMSKKPRKTRPHGQRKLLKATTKRPAASAQHDTPERIANALEAIAAHLSAAAPAPPAVDSFGSADAFVWHPNGRLSPVARAPPLSPAAPAPPPVDSFDSADAFVWHPSGRLSPVPRVSRVDLGLLKGIDRMRDILIENTERFADGLPD